MEQQQQQQQRLICLVGLPGSGKSHFASLLSAGGYIRVCQDELGSSRQRCVEAAARALRAGDSPVIDRCNYDAGQRALWARLAAEAGVPAVALELTPPVQVCVSRAAARVAHPTLRPEAAEAVIRRFAAEFQATHEGEGFARVLRLTGDEDADGAVALVGPAPAAVARPDLAAWNPSTLPPPAPPPPPPPPGGGAGAFCGGGHGRGALPPGYGPAGRGRGRGGGVGRAGGGRGRGGGGGGGRGPGPSAAVAALTPSAPALSSGRVPRHLDAPLGADPRPILLFDLNGTLISRSAWAAGAARTVRVRPGVHALRAALPPTVVRLGIFTSATPTTVAAALAALAASAGGDLFPTPALILSRAHTSPRPPGAGGGSGLTASSCAADRRAAHATVKPLARWFGDLSRVLLVDDEPDKSAPGEVRNLVRVPAWDGGRGGGGSGGGPACPALPALAVALATLVHAVGRSGDLREHTAEATAAVAAACARGGTVEAGAAERARQRVGV